MEIDSNVKSGETIDDLFAFQICAPNAEVGSVHLTGMPVVPTQTRRAAGCVANAYPIIGSYAVVSDLPIWRPPRLIRLPLRRSPSSAAPDSAASPVAKDGRFAEKRWLHRHLVEPGHVLVRVDTDKMNRCIANFSHAFSMPSLCIGVQ
nr:hypothetical protein [Cypionkella sp.]